MQMLHFQPIVPALNQNMYMAYANNKRAYVYKLVHRQRLDYTYYCLAFLFWKKSILFLQSVCSINAICGPGTTLMPKVRIESNFSVS